MDSVNLLGIIRNLGADVSLADVEAALAAKDTEVYKMEERQKYSVQIWDKISPINDVPAATILASRTDIPAGGEVYMLHREGKLIVFQPHIPDEGGLGKMTLSSIGQIAEAHLDSIVLASAEHRIEREIIEEMLRGRA